MPHSMFLCQLEGCTREAIPGCRYCRFCQRKGALRDYQQHSKAHAATLDARNREEPAAAELLYSFCFPTERQSTHTYAIGVRGAVKFGQSMAVTSRLEILQVGNHRKLRLLGCINSSQELELYIHYALRRQVIRGGWFRLNETSRLVIRLMRMNDMRALCRVISDLISAGEKKALLARARSALVILETGPLLV